jgi:hypothetical protein
MENKYKKSKKIMKKEKDIKALKFRERREKKGIIFV